MLLPAARPRVTIPELWDRARRFLASIFAEHGSARAQLHRRLDAKQRSAILRWLKPAERMARQLILVAALTQLLMTEQGRRLRAAARPLIPPGARKTRRPFAIVHTGINLSASLARHHQPTPAAPEAPLSETPACARRPVDPDDPETWRAPFRILRWLDLAPPEPPARSSRRHAAPDPRRLIRRIEAVRRVLANPSPRIRRLTAYLARLPRGALGQPPPVLRHRGRPNPVLRDEIAALHELADPAFEAFNTS